NIFSIGIAVILIMSMSLPALAATNYYDFSLNYRVVNGKDNGEFHSLQSGTAHIDGSMYISSSAEGAVGPNNVKYTLYKDEWGFDPTFGTVDGGTPRGYSTNFSGSYSGLESSSSKYYLLIYKVEDDGHNIQGSGELTD
ncbi:hypothetical protein, partial [Virgibacillus sp. DJP39]|uniref:hypothetical protein n=1 Tax=Virgibacillus sp. DJP39 TaxID=3409790 RepID=UPI003BB74378